MKKKKKRKLPYVHVFIVTEQEFGTEVILSRCVIEIEFVFPINAEE